MAKIVQALTRATKEYDPTMLSSLVRDLDAVINKLNTSFQQELELNRPTYQELRENFLARQNQNEGGIARLL